MEVATADRSKQLLPLIFRNASAGYVGGLVTDVVFYVLDSYKVQQQTQTLSAAGTSISSRIQISQLARGIGPISLLGSGTSFALFFSIYGPLKDGIVSSHAYASPTTTSPALASNSVSIAIASMFAAVPATIIGIPADTVKKQVVVGNYPSALSAATAIWRQRGPYGFLVGWRANLVRDIPFSAVKMTLYESMATLCHSVRGVSANEHLSPLDSSLVGFASGGFTAVFSNPLDVLNTRIKASVGLNSMGIIDTTRHIARKEGISVFFRGIVPRVLIFGFGSSVFWTTHSYAHTMLTNVIN
mmetsp:Transcript_39688/g.55101  ORF Transcript_39688/g.55101 Transcript_39688/m.55101 type:complete len:300 (+) Transcript_39688:46-945(+)